MINLTDDERVHFADWLEQESATDVQLAEQLRKLPAAAATPALAEKYSAEALAERVVAMKLRSIHSG